MSLETGGHYKQVLLYSIQFSYRIFLILLQGPFTSKASDDLFYGFSAFYYGTSWSLWHYLGSHTFQMMKFKGISRVIKGSTAHFQGYFWKTGVFLSYVNKISSNFSHLFEDFF